jgi:hypothetical protein
MGMDKILFTEKLKPIGYLKRKWSGATPQNGWEEQVLKLFPKPASCPDCTELEFIKKRGTWSKKCLICGEKTQVYNLVDK